MFLGCAVCVYAAVIYIMVLYKCTIFYLLYSSLCIRIGKTDNQDKLNGYVNMLTCFVDTTVLARGTKSMDKVGC